MNLAPFIADLDEKNAGRRVNVIRAGSVTGAQAVERGRTGDPRTLEVAADFRRLRSPKVMPFL